MRQSRDIDFAVRRGVRAGRRCLVVHLAVRPHRSDPAADTADDTATVGFAVSKAVGGAVVRNRVKRRLRHLVADRLDRLPAGGRLVVRANPAAASATSTDLARDLDGALGAALRKVRS
jgi:ribonuclease P protein component